MDSIKGESTNLYKLLISLDELELSCFNQEELEIIKLLEKIGILTIKKNIISNSNYILLTYQGKYLLIPRDDYSVLIFDNLVQIANTVRYKDEYVNINGDNMGIIPVLCNIKHFNIENSNKDYENIIKFNCLINDIENSRENNRSTNNLTIICNMNILEDKIHIVEKYKEKINKFDRYIISGFSFGKYSFEKEKIGDKYSISDVSIKVNGLCEFGGYIYRIMRNKKIDIQKRLVEEIMNGGAIYKYFLYIESKEDMRWKNDNN